MICGDRHGCRHSRRPTSSTRRTANPPVFSNVEFSAVLTHAENSVPSRSAQLRRASPQRGPRRASPPQPAGSTRTSSSTALPTSAASPQFRINTHGTAAEAVIAPVRAAGRPPHRSRGRVVRTRVVAAFEVGGAGGAAGLERGQRGPRHLKHGLRRGAICPPSTESRLAGRRWRRSNGTATNCSACVGERTRTCPLTDVDRRRGAGSGSPRATSSQVGPLPCPRRRTRRSRRPPRCRRPGRSAAPSPRPAPAGRAGPRRAGGRRSPRRR